MSNKMMTRGHIDSNEILATARSVGYDLRMSAKRRRNPSFPTHENYGAQDPSDLGNAARRKVDDQIRKYVMGEMKRHKPLAALDKAGIIQDAEYYAKQARDEGAQLGDLNRFIRFTTGKGMYPQLLLEREWSGYELLSFKTDASTTIASAGSSDEPEDVKLVCDLMRYTVTNKPAKLEATIDELTNRGKM